MYVRVYVCMYVCINYILITNLMHELLFIHKTLCPSTCFDP
jgi:hypothetical protein